MKNIHITCISHISKYVTYVQIICYFYLGTIIILYQRKKSKNGLQQQAAKTELYDAPLPYADITVTTSAPQDDDELYNHTHHGHTAPPPIYSTLAEGGAPADYSVITETQDTSDGGMVYSAVRKDGKKTTVSP